MNNAKNTEDISRPEGSPASPPSRSVSSRETLSIVALVSLATAAVLTYAFDPARAGRASILVAIGGLYAVLAAAALYRMHRRGELGREMRPRGGDLTLGAATAALLYGLGTAGHLAVTGPGSPRIGWIMRIYLQIGDPTSERRMLVSAAVFVIAALEEITWRGLVMRSLAATLDRKRALFLSSLLYAVVHAPTYFLLADPVAGPNPLVVLAALGCGLVWGTVATRTDRLLPAIFAHALFSWAVVEFPIWRP